MRVVMFPRFERRNYQEDLLSKVTGHRCKTKVESTFMWWADGEMTCRVLLSSIYVGVGRLEDPTLLYTGAYLQPIKKNRQGVGSISKIHRPAGMKQKIGIQNVMQVDENYVRYEAGGWPYICMLTIEIFLRQLKKNIVYCEFTFHLQSQSCKKK